MSARQSETCLSNRLFRATTRKCITQHERSFCFILSWDPTRALAMMKATTVDNSRLSKTQRRLTIKKWFGELQKNADKADRTARKSNPKHFNKRVRQSPVFCGGNLVYIGSPPTIKATICTTPDEDPSRKLRLKKDGPYPVLKVRDHKLKVEINGIYNVVSTIGVTLATTGEEASRSKIPSSPTSPDEGLDTEIFSLQHSAHNAKTSKYAVEKLNDDRRQNGRIQYTVRWYGYTTDEDTWKYVKSILQKFIARLHHRQRCARKGIKWWNFPSERRCRRKDDELCWGATVPRTMMILSVNKTTTSQERWALLRYNCTKCWEKQCQHKNDDPEQETCAQRWKHLWCCWDMKLGPSPTRRVATRR